MASTVFLEEMGLRISNRRKELNLSQEQLAEKIGISSQSVSCIELGKKGIRPENLAKLCDALSVPSDYILYGKRSERQMSYVMEVLSSLDAETYYHLETLVRLLQKK